MQFKALINFSGLITMKKGDIREIKDKEIYLDLLNAGYIEQVKEQKSTRKKVKQDEDQ